MSDSSFTKLGSCGGATVIHNSSSHNQNILMPFSGSGGNVQNNYFHFRGHETDPRRKLGAQWSQRQHVQNPSAAEPVWPLAQCAPGRTRTLNATKLEANEVPWAWQHTERHQELQQPLVIWDQSWYLSKAAGVLEAFVNPWELGSFPTLCHLWFSWKFTHFPVSIAAGFFLHYTWGMSASWAIL